MAAVEEKSSQEKDKRKIDRMRERLKRARKRSWPPRDKQERGKILK